MSRRTRMLREVRLTHEANKNSVNTPTDLFENSLAPAPAPAPAPEPEPAPEPVAEPTVQDILNEIQEDGVVTDAEETQLRELAKEMGISNWHNKSVKRLQSELAKF